MTKRVTITKSNSNTTTSTVKKTNKDGITKGKLTLTQHIKAGADKLTKGEEVAPKVVVRVTKGVATVKGLQYATTAESQVT